MSVGTVGQQEFLEQQAEREQEREARQTAQQMASQFAGEKGAAEPGYWDVIGDPDVSREITDDEHLGEFIATELSDKFALGNITHDDWESWQWQIENEFWTIRNEFKDGDSDLDSIDMATMYGADRPRLTNERARRLRSSMQVKKIMTSLSVGARGLRAGTEIHAVARTEGSDEDSESQGRLAAAKQWLAGK